MTFIKIAIAACALLAGWNAVEAQDRMPPIPPQNMTEAQKKAAKDLISGPRGTLAGPFVPLLRSPGFMDRLQKMGAYLRYDSKLGHKLNEFVILLTARQWTQQYEWYVHAPIARKAGVEQDVIDAIRDGRRPSTMTEDEQIVYDFILELRRDQSVSDKTYARAVHRFGEQGVIDMVGVNGYYSMIAAIMNVARTPVPPGTKPPLDPFPH